MGCVDSFLEMVQCRMGFELGTGFRKKLRFGHHEMRKGTKERRQNRKCLEGTGQQIPEDCGNQNGYRVGTCAAELGKP